MRKSATKFERSKDNSQSDLVCSRLNCLESSGVNPLVRRVMRTCFGSKPLSLAVWMIVEIRDTFLVPWPERLPKIISFSKHFGSRFSMKVRAGFRQGTRLSSCCSRMRITHSLNSPFLINCTFMSVSSSRSCL